MLIGVGVCHTRILFESYSGLITYCAAGFSCMAAFQASDGDGFDVKLNL